MQGPKNVRLSFYIFKRACSINAALRPNFYFSLDKQLNADVSLKKIKIRRHPGTIDRTVRLPEQLIEAVSVILNDYQEKELLADVTDLNNYLWSRRLPAEAHNLKIHSEKLFKEMRAHAPVDVATLALTQEETSKISETEKQLVMMKLKSSVYNWTPIEYGPYKSLLYLMARFSPDFTVLVNIFRELKTHYPDFLPKYFFDFGAGVGTGTWALEEVWPRQCKESMSVDISKDMNMLADRLLRGGNSEAELPFRQNSTFFKEYLPQSNILKYDLVLSSRTMFEIGNLAMRIRMVDILWRKVAVGGFLVLVEAGTKAGYQVMMESRDYLRHLAKEDVNYKEEDINVVAPCTHNMTCPLYADIANTHCNFEVNFQPLLPLRKDKQQTGEMFTYLVVRRGERSKASSSWPRVIRLPLHRSKHVIIRTCTPQGSYEQFTCTKRRHGTNCYQVCRSTQWGDLLPVNKTEENNIET